MASTDRRWKYDVYLSFDYGDTGRGFADLCDRLKEKGIETFMPEIRMELSQIYSTGKLCFSVPSTILTAIEESRFAIVGLSRNYASSSWCLEELAKICECMIPDKDRGILPVFYDIDLSDVRYQRGSFGEDFDRHERSGLFESDKIQQWRDVLIEVGNLSGWESRDYWSELELGKLIVDEVCSRLQPIETNKGDFEAIKSTKRAAIEDEPKVWESNENVEIRRPDTVELEPTMLDFIEDFEATTQAANRNSESESAGQWKHDVFLSFKGEDTRRGFLSHLYRELQNTKTIRTFKDDEQLTKGKDISQSLMKAIEESRFAIIVLSEKYAFSTWCLDELTKIFQCMEGKDTILPIFYYVDPSDVRYQNNSYGVAFENHESKARHAIEKVDRWRAALRKVGSVSGWDLNKYKSESELIVDIVEFVLKKVRQVSRGDFEEFEATREAMAEVHKKLNDDAITAIGVYGRGGVGKTAMVKSVGALAKKMGLFDHVVISLISRNPDLQKIQGELVNQLGLEMGENEEIETASRLKERILFILDDIWEKLDLSSIGIPSFDELQRCNSKVLLTTRIMEISHSMRCQAHIPLNVLSEEDSLKLFMKKSRKPFHGSADVYNEDRNVVGTCGGLPSALEEAAKAFGHKYVKEWTEAVSKAFGDNNDDSQKPGQEVIASQYVPTTDERDTFKKIELTYHTLMFDDAKSMFLLCCMFPEDYDIPIEELFRYSIGKGLLQYSDTLQEARDRAHFLIAYLKDSGLLLDGKKECIKMHCDIRNVAMSIVSEEGDVFFVKAGSELKDWPMDVHQGYSAISLMRNELKKLPDTLVCSKLQILLLQRNLGISDIPETFFQSPNPLRVFDLSYTGIVVLPSSFDLLTNLKALFLDSCKKITDISVLGKLKKVEILSLRKFPHKELPKEIGNMTSLRMLDITGGCVHKIPSKLISRLYRLEELYMICEFGNWGSQVKESVEQTNANFDEIIGLSRLSILKVYISDAACLPKDIEYLPSWIKYKICISRDLSSDMMLSLNDQPSTTLILDKAINGLPDWFINVVTEKTEKLEYRDSKGVINILEEHERGRLHGLKLLNVIRCHATLEELINATTWDPSKPVFESLEELHLLHLQCLKELCVGELPLGSLCNLKLLKVQTCRSLVNALLRPNLLQRLTNLETIFCVNMVHIKYVFGSEGLELGTILLTKLREMRLCALFELISIWNGPVPPAVFGNLKVLAVCQCTKLESLFPFDVARSLVQLEDLSVELCPNLSRVIEPSRKAGASLEIFMVFLGLKKLFLRILPSLTCFCTENVTFSSECPSLEYLYVDGCPQFFNPASASVKFNDQQHLNSLAKRWEDMHML
ncbi:probable disease resistance protein At4g27220 [Argentina anserina]|uniref:probable disease resistance protein At4g27220 n=1 Tax=Argentina anserina TaxID=57926 RepID=UPI00217627C0|nr:probable disease resistance protein At4g27220 [Potentilla anserina]